MPWLSIRSKLIIAFTGLSILPVILLGLHAIFSNAKMMERIALENLEHDIYTVREKTANFLGSIESDMRVIRHFPLLTQLVESSGLPPASSRNRRAELLNRLGAELLAFAQAKGIYYQVRIIDAGGDEVVRVQSADTAGNSTRYRIVGPSELRHTPEPFYTLLIAHLEQEQIAFVPAELPDRGGRRVPVISFAMPLNAPGGRIGVLVVNVFVRTLFEVIEAQRHLEVDSKTILVSGEGHYLYHSGKERDWNRLLASREEDNLQHDYPPEVIRQLLSGQTGTIAEGSDEIMAYAPLFQKPDSLQAFNKSASFMAPFFALESVRRDIILGPVYAFIWIFSGFLLAFVAIAGGLGLVATRQFTKPIAAMRESAHIIAGGKYSHRIVVDTHDEIEVLADQFNAMAAALESHELEIQEHRTKLVEIVERRTHELEAEKSKLQAILDHVPSAIILLDRDLAIQSASAVFSSITGHTLGAVRGKNCTEVFCRDGFCRECVARRALQTGRVQSHVDRIDDQKEGERYIEHVAMPMSHNGSGAEAILEIITDVTKRKQFERNLVQTEKLAAAGEMSAIIAHEFRNSLTSIKLILQLQREVKRIGRAEKESLTVALGSMNRMEQIVTELLNFARPQPLEFEACSLNAVIAESVAFTRPHIEKHAIVVTQQFDDSLPALRLDVPSMKEAFINLLLNAVDALRSGDAVSPGGGGGGTGTPGRGIRVLTRHEQLRHTLRDFVFAAGATGGGASAGVQTPRSGAGGMEIVLPKGTGCAVAEIQDDGCGISPSDARRVFDPFFTTKTNGTGLGLPMVKRTINAHGGIVTVSSGKNEGSVFRIYLPLTPRS